MLTFCIAVKNVLRKNRLIVTSSLNASSVSEYRTRFRQRQTHERTLSCLLRSSSSMANVRKLAGLGRHFRRVLLRVKLSVCSRRKIRFSKFSGRRKTRNHEAAFTLSVFLAAAKTYCKCVLRPHKSVAVEKTRAIMYRTTIKDVLLSRFDLC